VKRENAPDAWFSNCPQGRQKKCVRTEFLDAVDLGIQCDAHEKARLMLANRG